MFALAVGRRWEGRKGGADEPVAWRVSEKAFFGAVEQRIAFWAFCRGQVVAKQADSGFFHRL